MYIMDIELTHYDHKHAYNGIQPYEAEYLLSLVYPFFSFYLFFSQVVCTEGFPSGQFYRFPDKAASSS